MKITIQDVPSVYSNRTQRLSKSSIELTTAPYAILVLRISLGLLFLAHGCLKVFTFTLLPQVARCIDDRHPNVADFSPFASVVAKIHKAAAKVYTELAEDSCFAYSSMYVYVVCQTERE